MRILSVLLLSALLLFGSNTYQKKDLYKTKDGVLTDKQHKPITGDLFLYHDTGEAEAVVEYKNGLLHGMARFYTKEGHPSAEMMYINGQEYGTTKSFHTNGKVSTVSSYVKGVIIGTEYYFSKEGRKTFEIKYKKGVVVSGIQFERSGNILHLSDKDLKKYFNK